MKHFVLVDKNEKILSVSFIDSVNYTMSKEFNPNCVIFDENFYNLMIEKCPVLIDSEADQKIILNDLTKGEIEILKNNTDKDFKPTWKSELDKVKCCPQRQDSMVDQMKDLWQIANKFGFYDAADHIRTICKF
jgi:hypothetical protein